MYPTKTMIASARPEGGDVVSVLRVAMMGHLPSTALRDAVLPHPTLVESLNDLFATLD